MQSMPLLLRQSIRSTLQITRSTSRPLQAKFRPTPPSSFPAVPTRNFSICLQCRFRRQSGLYSAYDDKGKPSNDAERLHQAIKEASSDAIPIPETGTVGKEPPLDTSAVEVDRAAEQGTSQEVEKESIYRTESEQANSQGTGADGARSGGLPSYLESRRSQVSKQFTTMMDNIQSNVFVAGQRLNDLTGYSGIEALKNEIHSQEERLRAARSNVRKAKDEYSAAITRRSTSQREVNELLQRKHAWSPTDLERFTLLYRNDHTNEVAEAETQEALSAAEREAEEAAASLSKSILSRYHEEQVWSDKIRRMSTWGTWGLMGVNVLLFLIFQIAVEPWRRRRLVKGFEDKVVEAIEKEKALIRTEIAEGTTPAFAALASATPEQVDSAIESSISSLETSTTEEPAKPIVESSNTAALVSETPPTTTPESLSSRLSNISSSPLSLEYWQTAFNELFSERSVSTSQRDLTVAAIQSAAAGAAVMGLVLALVNPR
ncbi:hypothetical protein N7481_002272 [Penicillium waksmanii]|uniref:uncharacterized protein n=1 Tax=Penicillium waksmanii TaxID=69791 RepID=UPI0025494BE9|nr:uncharacterized protein N7481_002272 [Penicillium waksmanii]KAJ5995295.1 hypothetical protein N7481_002272 [Penicillium waksmanii]